MFKKPGKGKYIRETRGTYREVSSVVDPNTNEIYYLGSDLSTGGDQNGFTYPKVPPPLPGFKWGSLDKRDLARSQQLWDYFWSLSVEEQVQHCYDKPNMLKYYEKEGLPEDMIIRDPETKQPSRRVCKNIVPYPDGWPHYPESDPFLTTECFHRNPEAAGPLKPVIDPNFQAECFTVIVERGKRKTGLQKMYQNVKKITKPFKGSKKSTSSVGTDESEPKKVAAAAAAAAPKGEKLISESDFYRNPTQAEIEAIMRKHKVNEGKARSLFWDEVVEKASQREKEKVMREEG